MPKLPISQMTQFIMRNPFTAAAAVFAPVFAQNEDRGYFRTALITTPVVFAVGGVGPQLFGGVKGVAREATATRNLLNKAEKWTRFEQPTYNDLNMLFQDKSTPSNVLERAVSNYLVAERRSRDYLKEQRTLSKLFNRKFILTQDLIQKGLEGDLKAQARIAEIEKLQTSKGRLITNAMQSARRSSLTPAEWAQEVSPTWDASATANLSNDDMIAMFDQYSNRPEFVKTLKNRLREIKKLNYSGTLQTADGGPMGVTTSELPIDFGWGDAQDKALQAQAPEAYKYLKEAKELGNIKDVTAVAEDVTSGRIGRILSVKVSRREGGNIRELSIPIVDMATGTVRLSPNAVGVADWVIDPFQQQHRIDTWVAKMLAEQPKIPIHEQYAGQPSLESEISAHAYWHAGDPMDARRMAELEAIGENTGQFTAQARKLRSYAAKYTKLPLFLNEKGSRVSYRDLSPSEQQVMVRRTLNSNQFINMSGEAGTYEGRFVRREAALLSPFGAPSAEKQDSIWRSVTKEFQLRSPEGLPPEARPGWRTTAWEALTGNQNLPAAKFTTASIDPQARTAIINEMKAAGRHDVATHLGRMGETGWILNESFSNNLTVEGISKYNVNELGVKVGDVVSPDDVIGFNDYNRVVPRHLGTVTDIAKDESGFVVNIKHELGMQGAKADIGGVKGMIPVTLPNEHFEQLRGIVNDYYKRTGSGDFIPSTVTTLAPAEYFANKVEPTQAYLGMGQDLVSRLQASGAGDVASTYLGRMESEMATTYEGGQLVIDASKLKSLKDVDAAERLRTLSSISEDFFQKAGDAIRSAGGYQDPVLTAYVQSGKELGDWMLKNQLPAMGFTWDHSLVNAPRFASITHDIAAHMAFGQNYAGIKALRSRLVTSSGGDAQQSLDFMKHVMTQGFNKPLGDVVPAKGAFLSPGDLHLAKNRADSIFDPSVAGYKKNFTLDLGNGVLVPVPGTDAYGAEAKMYEPGKYQTRPWQHTLQDLAFEKDPKKQTELRSSLMDQYQEAFGVGKGNVLRPYEQDPMSIAGVFSTYMEEDNPFTARISKELAQKVRSKRLRDALLRGEEVMGALHRQPTNQMLYMKFKVDEAMTNTLDVAVAERITRAYIGDQDKDTAYALLFDANIRTDQGKTVVSDAASKLESDAAMEAYESINGGKQLKYLEAWESVKGTPEVANRVTDFKMKALSQRTEDFATKIENRVGVAVNRTAGAAIGSYSNVVTEINEHMLRSAEILKDPLMAARLNAIMFDIRQSPIAARKAPSFTLEQAMAHLGQLKNSLATADPELAANRVHTALMNLGQTLNPKFKDTNEFQYLTNQGVTDINTWARGRSEMATMAKQALTATVDSSRPFKDQYASKMLPDIFRNVDQVLGPVHGGRAAAENVTRLGVVAEGLAEQGRNAGAAATGEMGRIFKRHGKTLALGLGVMAAASIAMTPRTAPMASFSRASGNRFRPEERMGVSDSVPGEPVSGQMAPSRPPRRMGVVPPNVRTAVVAPMNQTSDLEVKMRAVDRSRAAETARQISQVPGSGDTNVTINYRDRTKLRSLRTREKIREIRQ